ncbi:acid-sensing ion channel 2-like [Saccoglossus kowalevskii]
MCGCVDTMMVTGYPRCMVLNKEQERCRQLVYYMNKKRALNCNCREPCTETTYQKTLSQSYWPSKSYLIEKLLGDIGGTLGLYIGLSIITVFELLEFLAMVFRCWINRFSNRITPVHIHIEQ